MAPFKVALLERKIRGQMNATLRRKEKRSYQPSSHVCVCVCLLYCEGSLVKISCHFVLKQQGVRENRRGVVFLLFFFPPLLSLFPPFLSVECCMCSSLSVCVYTLTGTLESFTDYLAHAMSFWRAFIVGGLSGRAF